MRPQRPRPPGEAEVPRLPPRGLAYEQEREANEEEAVRNAPAAVNAELWRIYHAGTDAYDAAGLDRDSDPSEEAIADALARLRELEPKLRELGGYNDETADQIRRNIDAAEANLGDEDARDAYDSALDDAADAAAMARQRLEKFQVEIALLAGCEIDPVTGLLRPDLAKLAAQAGTIKTLWSKEGGVGKSFAVSRRPSTVPNAHTMPNANVCPMPTQCPMPNAPMRPMPNVPPMRPMPNVRHARPCPMPVHQAEAIEEAFQRHIDQVGGKYGSDGAMAGCVRLSSIDQISNMVFMLYSAYEKKEVDEKGREISSTFSPPPHMLFILDLARALSDSPAKEPAFYGTIETLIGKKLSSAKYKGVQITWPHQPSVLIFSNGRPIQCRAGTVDFVPRCFLSATRLIGNVWTVEKVGCEVLLLQDTVCDGLALKVREWETTSQQTYVAEIKRVVPKTVEQLFKEYVMCDFTPVAPELLPHVEWTSYNHLHALFDKVSPIKVNHGGPGDNLKKLIATWFKNHEAFLDEDEKPIRLSAWCKRLVDVGAANSNGHTKFAFKHTPGVGARAAERFRNGGNQGSPADG